MNEDKHPFAFSLGRFFSGLVVGWGIPLLLAAFLGKISGESFGLFVFLPSGFFYSFTVFFFLFITKWFKSGKLPLFYLGTIISCFSLLPMILATFFGPGDEGVIVTHLVSLLRLAIVYPFEALLKFVFR